MSKVTQHTDQRPLTSYSPAERTAMLLAFKGPSHNFGCTKRTAADCAKTARLAGRSNEARTQ